MVVVVEVSGAVVVVDSLFDSAGVSFLPAASPSGLAGPLGAAAGWGLSPELTE